jgi:hypothetical protein
MDAAPAWERQHGEPAKSHAAFRVYRDLPPAQRVISKVAEQVDMSPRRCAEWAVEWDWRARAEAWDDELHRVEDRERLELIRSMHTLHRKAGRAAMSAALRALSNIDIDRIPVGQVARLMELGARLERSTLLTSVEELQGIDVEVDDSDDPWERIARELDPNNAVEDVPG